MVCDAVFVESFVLFDCSLAELDVVFFGSCEVEEGWCEVRGADDAEVDLNGWCVLGLCADGCFCFACDEDLMDEGLVEKEVCDCLCVCGLGAY